jgi:hypothetical protein
MEINGQVCIEGSLIYFINNKAQVVVLLQSNPVITTLVYATPRI